MSAPSLVSHVLLIMRGRTCTLVETRQDARGDEKLNGDRDSIRLRDGEQWRSGGQRRVGGFAGIICQLKESGVRVKWRRERDEDVKERETLVPPLFASRTREQP